MRIVIEIDERGRPSVASEGSTEPSTPLDAGAAPATSSTDGADGSGITSSSVSDIDAGPAAGVAATSEPSGADDGGTEPLDAGPAPQF